MVVKIEVMLIKERGFTETFHFRNDSGDLKGFQQNLKHYFYKYLSQSPVNKSARTKKSDSTLWKKHGTSLARLSRQCFLQKQSMILPKVLFTLIDD